MHNLTSQSPVTIIFSNLLCLFRFSLTHLALLVSVLESLLLREREGELVGALRALGGRLCHALEAGEERTLEGALGGRLEAPPARRHHHRRHTYLGGRKGRGLCHPPVCVCSWDVNLISVPKSS